MRTRALVVFAAAALLALPVVATAGPSREVAQLQGSGFLRTLACGACIGSMAFAYTTGYGGVYSALLGARDGALAAACVSACVE